MLMGAPPSMGSSGAPPSAPSTAPSTAPMDDGQLFGGPKGPSADMQKQLDSVTAQFRDLQVSLRSLAKAYPAAAKDFDAANNNLVSGMMKVTRLLAQQQPQTAPA